MRKLALISVSNKIGVIEFAKKLIEKHNYQLLSTGGTAKALVDGGVEVTEVSAHTGFPEMMEGRIKTLHPKIHGGILARRDKGRHVEQAKENNIPLIDLVVVNLYPFEKTVSSLDCTIEKAIENIDIGGPAMLRSAAKNHAAVTTVCDPGDYDEVLKAMANGQIEGLRKKLALKVFNHTSGYDQAIASYLENQQEEPDLEAMSGFGDTFSLNLPKIKQLRYGENPHQQGALYGNFFDSFEQLHGKELSYNNILDISSATYLIGEFERPTVGILKHTNPCGVGSGENLDEAWEKAFATDRKSPFGGIIVVNQTISEHLAQKLSEFFCEVIIAPGFNDAAIEILTKKKNVRLMKARDIDGPSNMQEVKSVIGGLLVQDRDFKSAGSASGNFKVVTEKQPSSEDWNTMMFGWRVVKHVKSNAIVYASKERTLGIGAGQMSRVDASAIAVMKAKQEGLSLEGSIVASDAFFPFPDALEKAAEAGAKLAIQPGGSKNDPIVIERANELGIAMVFTGKRHFKH